MPLAGGVASRAPGAGGAGAALVRSTGGRGHGSTPRDTVAGGGLGVADLSCLFLLPLFLLVVAVVALPSLLLVVGTVPLLLLLSGTVGGGVPAPVDAGETGTTTRAGEAFVERRMVRRVVRSPRRK